MTASAKSLFRAISGKKSRQMGDDGAFPALNLPHVPVQHTRRAQDYYPTAEGDVIRALLHYDWPAISAAGSVWEPAVGEGHLAREITARGLPVIASDLIDRGYLGTIKRSFFDFDRALAPAIITNPPYGLISAKGKAAWLKHTLAMEGWTYLALLLSAEWDFAVSGGLGRALADNPYSYCYKIRWKIDFTGEGNPAQRNVWFVWNKNDLRSWHGTGPHPEPSVRMMDRVNTGQGELI